MNFSRLRVGQTELKWLANALKAVDFFSSLTMGQLDKILSAITLYRYPADSVIMSQGDRDRALFVLYKGRMVVSRRKFGVFSMPIASLHPGEFFGEMALLQKKPRSASVKTTEESEVFVLLAEEFSYVLEKSPQLGEHMRQVTARRRFEQEQWERN